MQNVPNVMEIKVIAYIALQIEIPRLHATVIPDFMINLIHVKVFYNIFNY